MSKIVVISPGHCGTRLLTASLFTHSQIKGGTQEPISLTYNQCSIEYYNFIKNNYNIDLLTLEKQLIPKKEKRKIKQQLRSYEYIDFVFSKQDVVKCLYTHFFQSDMKRYLDHHKDILILHLCRRNISSIIFSQMIHNNNFKKQFDISFYRILNRERFIDYIYQNRIYKMYYEDMIERWHYYIKKIEIKANINEETITKAINKINRKKFTKLFNKKSIPLKIRRNFNMCFWNIEE